MTSISFLSKCRASPRLAVLLMQCYIRPPIQSASDCQPKHQSMMAMGFSKAAYVQAKWMEQLVEDCQKSPNHSVCTIGGRLRCLKNISHQTRKIAAAEERKAVNTVPQGSAADIAKTAMIRLHHQIRQQLPGQCRLLLMVRCLHPVLS